MKRDSGQGRCLRVGNYPKPSSLLKHFVPQSTLIYGASTRSNEWTTLKDSYSVNR
jgi:hypothetical protein